MPCYQFGEYTPKKGDQVFIAPSADIIGRVNLKTDASVWFRTVIRGDIEPIEVGIGSNIQDLSVLHTTAGTPLIIGDGVSVGHSVTLHSCMVEDNCLIGMGAVILDNVRIGKNSLVAAGSLVPPGKEFPDYSYIRGNPAKFIRPLSEEEKKMYGQHYNSYIKYKNQYLAQKF